MYDRRNLLFTIIVGCVDNAEVEQEAVQLLMAVMIVLLLLLYCGMVDY